MMPSSKADNHSKQEVFKASNHSKTHISRNHPRSSMLLSPLEYPDTVLRKTNTGLLLKQLWRTVDIGSSLDTMRTFMTSRSRF
jgi:hypothetical protein